MTDLPESGLERRATAIRGHLLDTIDTLERRRARVVRTVNDARRLFALVADGAAMLGAVSMLLALLRSRRPAETMRRPRRSRSVLEHAAVFALLAGVAYVARRATAPASARHFLTASSAPRPIA